MRWRRLAVGLVLGLLAFIGAVAQYGGEGGYGGVHLQFTGRVVVSGGSCQQLAQDLIQCQVPAGTQGTVELTATVTPSSYTVTISALALPGWASFQPVSAYGTAQATCGFTPPAGAAGQIFELRFRASTGYGLFVDLRVVLNVVAAQPPTGPEHPQPGYVTDDQGRFSVPVEYLPNTRVTGVLTQCTVRPLAGVPVEVTLIPKPGRLTIGSLSDVGAVRISTPYGESTVTDFRLLSSMDIYGRVTRTINVGTVCIMPTGPVTPSTQPIEGTTDEEGKFSLPLPGQPGTTITGRLTECTVRPLPNQKFTLTPIYGEGTLTGFTVAVPGYTPATVTEFGRFSLFGLTSYMLGDVCLLPAAKPDLRFGEGDFCIVVAPGDTPDEQVFAWERHFHEQDERLNPVEIRVPMRCKVGIRFSVENPGDVPITRSVPVRLAVVGLNGQELGYREVEVTLRPSGSTLLQKGEGEGILSVSLGDGLPTFRLVIDPENVIPEKDETNNTYEHRCCPAYHQEGKPKVQAKDGVLKVEPDGSWVVGRGKPLTVEGEAVLGTPRPVATAAPSSNFRTEVPCPTLCPLALRYEWDFGDGAKATGKTATHTYRQNGRYTVTLTTVLGDDRRTTTQEVEVTDKPVLSLTQRYRRVFVHRVPVTNAFTATVEPNGNVTDRVEFTLNGRPVSSAPLGNDQYVCQLDMGALLPWPQRNTLVAVARGKDQDGNPVSSDPVSLEIPVAPVPSWLEWTLAPGPGQKPLRAVPQDGSVLYQASYSFPYPPIDISYTIPDWVPLVDGEYGFSASASFGLSLSSLGQGETTGGGKISFAKEGGDWTFELTGEANGRATLLNSPPITLTGGEFSLSLEGSVSKSFDISDVFPAIKAATRIPLIGRAIKWLASRASLGLGLSLGVGGEVSFWSADPGCCLAGIDCKGSASLSGGLQVSLTVDLEIVSATGYGGGKLAATFVAPGGELGLLDFDSLTLSGELGLSVSVDLWLCEASWSPDPLTFTCRILSPPQGFVTEPEGGEWSFPERPYVTPTYSTFRGELSTVEELATTELWLIEEAFPHARPKLVRDPALTMVTWTTDAVEKPFPLGREIAFSVGPDLQLGQPSSLTDNLLPDSQVDLAFDWGQDPVAIWVRHVSPPPPPHSEQDLTPALLSGLEIVYAKYDRVKGGWGNQIRLTENDFIDHSPRFLYGPWGITGAIWAANVHGAPFPDSSVPDTLYLARWDGQDLGAPEVLREADSALMRAFVDLGGEILYVWVEDRDENWGTRGDEELLWALWDGTSWSEPQLLTQDDLDDERPVLLPAGLGQALLLWVRIRPGEAGNEGVLLTRPFGPDGWGPESVLLEGHRIFDFHVAQGLSGDVAVVWSEFGAQGPDLFAAAYDPVSGAISEPKQLTADQHLESQVDAVFDGHALTLAFLRTTVEERTETVRYTGPDAGDPSVYHCDEEIEVTAPMPGATHLYLLEATLP